MKSALIDSCNLWNIYTQNPTVANRNNLVEKNLGLVRSVVLRFIRRCGSLPYDDLYQVGAIGLIKAVERFDSQKGNAFSTYAMPLIRGEISHYLRDRSSLMKISRADAALVTKVRRFVEQHTQQKGHTPTAKNIAQALNVSMVDLQRALMASSNKKPLSLDINILDEGSKEIPLLETLLDTQLEDLRQIQLDALDVHAALRGCDIEVSYVLKLIYIQGLSQAEAARELSVHVQYIHRAIKRGILQINEYFEVKNSKTTKSTTKFESQLAKAVAKALAQEALAPFEIEANPADPKDDRRSMP